MGSTTPAILAIEDAFLVGLQLKRDLEALGFEVVGPASTVAEAMELLDHPGLFQLGGGGHLLLHVLDCGWLGSVPGIPPTAHPWQL